MEAQLIFRALYMGFFTGYVVALPTGPAGLESIRWTLQHGFRTGMTVVCGVLLSDVLDVLLINFGILQLFHMHPILEVVFWLISGLGICLLGVSIVLKARHHERSGFLDPHPKTDKKHRPFLTGFLMNFTNPASHFFWLTLSSTVISGWRGAGVAAYTTFCVTLLCGQFLGLTTLNILASHGKKLTPPKMSGTVTRLIPYAIALMGCGFFVTGLVKLFQFLQVAG